jgi:hypothetical protein
MAVVCGTDLGVKETKDLEVGYDDRTVRKSEA